VHVLEGEPGAGRARRGTGVLLAAALLAAAERGGTATTASATGVRAVVKHAAAASADSRVCPAATGGDTAAATAGVPVAASH